MKKPKRIVVTGALGHIGSKVIRDLPVAFPDVQIIMIDNLVTQRYGSLFDLPTKGSYKFIGHDILDIDFENILKPHDIVIHLAAVTDAAQSFQNQEDVELVNYKGTIKLANACTKVGCKLIFPSSTSVYGSTATLVDENCPKSELKPQSPYADNKLKVEDYLKRKSKQGLKFITFRFGTICGVSKGMRFHTAVNKFCWQSVIGQPLSVWTTALHQKRPYLSLSDASKAIQFSIQNDLFDGEIYNIVTDNLTVNDIVESIKKTVPHVKIEFVDSQIMNQLTYEVASEKFRKKGFKHSGNVHKDIKETIKLLKKAHDHAI